MPYNQYKPEQYSYSVFLNIVFIGLVIIVLILLGRQIVNWYIKHNAMLQQLSKISVQSKKATSYLKSIEIEMRKMRQQKENEIMKSSRFSNNSLSFYDQ